jgi:hypothetical protein
MERAMACHLRLCYHYRNEHRANKMCHTEHKSVTYLHHRVTRTHSYTSVLAIPAIFLTHTLQYNDSEAFLGF